MAESEDEAILADDARQGDAGIPLAHPVADAEAELIRVRDLEIVVQQVHLAGRTVDERLQVRYAVEILRIPRNTARG